MKRDSCVLSIEVMLLLQGNSEEIQRTSFVQQLWYSFHSRTFLVCRWSIVVIAASVELRGIVGCWEGMEGCRKGLPGAMVEYTVVETTIPK
jgi:hypothetical protein